jgi:hypothetical protein
LLLVLLAVSVAGCVERRLWVRSEPAGARVFFDGVPVGETPVEIPFAHYGTREVALRAAGHEPARLRVDLSPPWYAWPGLDLVTEVLLPWTIRDERRLEVRLIPATERSLAELAERGEQARKDSRGAQSAGR